MTTTPATTPATIRADLLRLADEWAPTLRARGAETEELRQLPAETIDEFDRHGFASMITPTSLGGDGLDADTLLQWTRRLAHGCTSSAWTLSFLVLHNWLLAKFPEDARRELFDTSTPWPLAPAPLAPTGAVTPVEGGYQLSGRWDWATGIRHANWVIVHAVQTEPEFTTRFLLVPVADIAIDDVWHTSGMRGTGSDTISADRVFVPAHRSALASEFMTSAEPVEGDGLHGLPVAPVLAMVASAPALGAAEAAVELYRERIAARVLAYTLGDKAADQPVTQARLGAVLSDLAAARTRWDAAAATLTACVGREVSVEERMEFRLTAAATVRAARQIVSTIAEGAGASVYFEGSPFQRIQRDLEVLKGHVVFDWDRTTELAGRVALGFELRPTDMV